MNLIKLGKNAGKSVRPLFGPQFCCHCWQVLALLDIRHCSKLQSCAISKKTNKPNLRKCTKKLISAPILACVAHVWASKLFSSVLPPLDVRHCHGLSFMQFQGKRMIQTQENNKKPHVGLIYVRWIQIWLVHHFFLKSGFVNHQISWSAIIMYNIRKI